MTGFGTFIFCAGTGCSVMAGLWKTTPFGPIVVPGGSFASPLAVAAFGVAPAGIDAPVAGAAPLGPGTAAVAGAPPADAAVAGARRIHANRPSATINTIADAAKTLPAALNAKGLTHPRVSRRN
jgi:hypothetical protein